MLLKITPVIRNGRTGKPSVEETDSMDVALKQATMYVKGTNVFKFFVITKVKDNELETDT